ncbi:MAG: hypothetical protein ACLQVK_22395 [Acidimicrobiales bacterium]|jgi:hypothetical protein
MATYVVRVWVPDRPGALGAVASRIGAVRGDLVGVEILERGAGRAIDELVVELPRPDLLDLMISEVNQVDGVDVEDVREVPGAPVDPRLDALETAAYLVERHDPADLLRALVAHVARDFESDWAAVVDPGAPQPLTSTGALPPEAWVFAFVQGARASLHGKEGAGVASPNDVAWADMSVAGLVVVLGRDGRPFRVRERRQLSALARIADNRWVDLVRGSRAPSLGPSSLAQALGHPAGSGAGASTAGEGSVPSSQGAGRRRTALTAAVRPWTFEPGTVAHLI